MSQNDVKFKQTNAVKVSVKPLGRLADPRRRLGRPPQWAKLFDKSKFDKKRKKSYDLFLFSYQAEQCVGIFVCDIRDLVDRFSKHLGDRLCGIVQIARMIELAAHRVGR